MRWSFLSLTFRRQAACNATFDKQGGKCYDFYILRQEYCMKKLLPLITAAIMVISFTACETPDDFQLDIYKGAQAELKLLHLNANGSQKKWQIEGIAGALRDAEAIEKDISLFGYYPDFTVEVTSPENPAETIRAVVDINGEWVEFYYMENSAITGEGLYRSKVSAEDFLAFIHVV